MGLLIKGGEIVTAETRQKGDIFIENETISAIGSGLAVPPGTEVVDAMGKLVYPGFIDPHVHIHLPFMGTFAKENHAAASAAALIGGTTSFIEMACPSRKEDALETYHIWKQKAEGNSACDYAFHMGVTRYDAKTEAQLTEIVKDGTTSFKIFLSYKNFFGVDDEEMFHTLKLAAKLGIITTAHCENAELVGQLQQLLLAEGRPGRSGMSPAVRRPWKQRAPRDLRLLWSRPAPPATWCICLARRRCAWPWMPRCAASSCTLNRCCLTSCLTRVMPNAPVWRE